MLAEGEKPTLHAAGFDETYTWGVMVAMADVYSGKKTLAQFDSVLNDNISRFPKTAYRLYFTSNHDENSWNGTEFEKYGEAYKTFAVFTQTMYQSVPLIYSGQEVPNKKRLKFFVKDPIAWDSFGMAPFYQKLLSLRKTNPALAADANYKKLSASNDAAIFAYLREKGGHKVLVVLNFSAKKQTCSIKDPEYAGIARNVFSGKVETLKQNAALSLDAWGYKLYEYR